MNDILIRKHFHRKILQKHHKDKHTLVVDELGLNHGKCRADIAVVNGLLTGFEIKSNEDSLYRLPEQVDAYNEIFDEITIVVGSRHYKNAKKRLPKWWGIVLASPSKANVVKFTNIRKPNKNKNVEPTSIARLLWRNEVINKLRASGIPNKSLRQPRASLYELLSETLAINQLRKFVIETLKSRKNWRCHASPLQHDDLCPPAAMSISSQA